MSGGIGYMEIYAICKVCGFEMVITQLEQKYCSHQCKRIAYFMRKGYSREEAQEQAIPYRERDFSSGYCEACNDHHDNWRH
jgi:hypothetical protein